MLNKESIKTKTLDIIENSTDRNTTLLEISKMLKNEVYHYDWVGFYLFDAAKDGLFLGPYTGASTDHTFIPTGKGVCGQVAQHKQPMVVEDVNAIENYLSCSINVQSEIVVPVLKDGKFVAELDIDSHSPAPFTTNDTELLEFICQKLSVLF